MYIFVIPLVALIVLIAWFPAFQTGLSIFGSYVLVSLLSILLMAVVNGNIPNGEWAAAGGFEMFFLLDIPVLLSIFIGLFSTIGAYSSKKRQSEMKDNL